MPKVNKTVQAEILPQAVVINVETMLKDYKTLPPVQRMNLGRMIQSDAVQQLRTEKTALESKLLEIASLIGENVTPSTAPKGGGSKGSHERGNQDRHRRKVD